MNTILFIIIVLMIGNILIHNIKNYNFLEKYQRLQEGIMFDELINFSFTSVGISNIDKSPYWNLALINNTLKLYEVEKVEEVFEKHHRKPTFYFELRNDLSKFIKTLEKRKYKKSFEDSWQFWRGRTIDEKNFRFVNKVESKKSLKLFLDTFNRCYLKNDPQNPYGELGDYLKVAENVWHKHHTTNRLEYFIVYKNKKPVAVSTLTNFDKIGYISNVGSLKLVRGEGYGKLATLYCVAQSIRNKNQYHCLATEEGAYPNEFYKRIGFKTIFTAAGFTK